ncbi:F-box domain-containing protein [Caenorhabditis elegans]|uniref:F-box domain-containing protein n=1 Tax=Caenorhabditis elegans TaxID=6239 RepID=Q2WF62_CAEEL|nr:F-box domain-containing protein [Caenorhabditis elegans]CCD73930.1 F-box domain-containing protein [Caenorhabditis elegans]|eukprot:NP_001040879.1 F-box A protein [Caenorhabditis elegans]
MARLTTLPIEIINEVIEKLEPIHRLTLRNVSRNFRTAVDSHGIGCEEAVMSLRPDNKVVLTIDGEQVVPFNNLDVILKDELDDICVVFESEDQEKRRNLVKYLASTLKNLENLENLCTVRNLEFNGLKALEILLLLPFFNVQGSLHIERITGVEKLEELVQLSQWKKVSRLNWYNQTVNVALLGNFFHIPWFYIVVDSFSVDNAVGIRDDLLKNGSFQYCYIRFPDMEMNIPELARVFKPDYTDGESFEYGHAFTVTLNSSSFCIRRNE